MLAVAACGRSEDDAGDPRGGSGGKPGTGGQSAAGASGGTGGKLGTGGSGKGGSTATGGSSGSGGATNAGGGVVSDGEGGEGGEGGAAAASVPLGEGSWNTTLALTITKSVGTSSIKCTAAAFTLHLSPSGNDLKAISGADGSVLVGGLVGDTQSKHTYTVSQALAVPTRGNCDLSSINITELTLQASDADGDGTADGITGKGKANGMMILGDQGFTVELSFTLEGVPDATKPSLLLPSNPHPLDGVLLRTSEPVALTSSVRLTSTGTDGATQLLSGNTASDGAFGNFSSAVILPFGSSWKLSATGGDLANLPFDVAALPPLAVLADPGVFAQDGFESAPALTLTGEAKIVASVGSVSATTGTKSLFVPPDSSASLHLARASGTSSVRFSVRPLTKDSGGTASNLFAEAGVIGGSMRVRPAQSLVNTPSTTTSDGLWKYVGPKQDVTLPLTESGTDVAIRIAMPVCRGICPTTQALLIDDLRVE